MGQSKLTYFLIHMDFNLKRIIWNVLKFSVSLSSNFDTFSIEILNTFFVPHLQKYRALVQIGHQWALQ